VKLVRAWAFTGVTSYRQPRLESSAAASADGCGAVAIRSRDRWEVYRIDATGLEMFVGYALAALRDVRSEAA
jgi:hypothetical protein